jgi:hypothetical protein
VAIKYAKLPSVCLSRSAVSTTAKTVVAVEEVLATMETIGTEELSRGGVTVIGWVAVRTRRER